MQRGRKQNRQLDIWLGIPLLNLLATFRRKRPEPLSLPRKIGLMCSPALGDTLLFSAVLQDLRAAYPDAQIVHIAMPQNVAAAEIIPGASRLILVSLTRPHEAIWRIRAERFDMLLDFSSWQRLTALLTLLSGAKYTVGFCTPGQRRGRGYDRAVLHCNEVHEVENFRALLAGSGLTPPVAVGHDPVVATDARGELPFAAEANLVAFHLWASGQRSGLREWPEERWIELAHRIAQPKMLFLVTGALSDRARATPFVEQMRAAGLRAELFISPDGLRTLAEVLRRVRLMVSVNTGVMHLAVVAGAPTVSLNGPTSSRRWGARGPCAANVEPSDGSGGYLNLGFEFEGHPEDVMQRITVKQVVEVCGELLARCRPVTERLPATMETLR